MTGSIQQCASIAQVKHIPKLLLGPVKAMLEAKKRLQVHYSDQKLFEAAEKGFP